MVCTHVRTFGMHLVIIFWLTHGRNFPILSPSKSSDFVDTHFIIIFRVPKLRMIYNGR